MQNQCTKKSKCTLLLYIYKLKRYYKKRAVIRARTYRRARVCARIAREKGLDLDENAHRGRSGGKE